MIAFFFNEEQLEAVKVTMNNLFESQEVKLPGTELYVKLWLENEGQSKYTWSLTDKGSIFYLTIMRYKKIDPPLKSPEKQSNISREQTEDWIQEKLNKYIARNSVTRVNVFDHGTVHDGPPELTQLSTLSNVMFKFSGDDLIITCHVKETTGGKNEKEYERTIKVPVYNLDEFSCWSTGIAFRSKFNSFEEKNSDGSNLKCDYAGFDFSGEDEENLSIRLQTAFAHLKSFVSKPKSNEVF